MSTEALWAAVDAITKSTTKRVFRDPDPEWLDELRTRSDGFCDVQSYRRATVSHGSIPSLWAQAEMALTAGTESPAGNPSPLAQRSPADMDLMEIMLTIREAIGLQFAPKARERVTGRSAAVTATADVPEQLRKLASYVIAHEPDHIAWWEFRISQWARLLAVYLKNVEQETRSRRIRDTACPNCGADHVRIEIDKEWQNVPPLLIDFKDHYVRAAQCTACAKIWWRGENLFELAEAIAYAKNLSDEEETMTA